MLSGQLVNIAFVSQGDADADDCEKDNGKDDQ